ncbi:MAG: hypothetical protein QOJ89_2526 [bacterium]|jgi:hypothetical protein
MSYPPWTVRRSGMWSVSFPQPDEKQPVLFGNPNTMRKRRSLCPSG